MKIKILLFGVVRDIIGENTVEMDLNSTISIKDFKQMLQKKYAELKEIENFAIAVNEEYANKDYTIQENDVLAIIPPVSGG